VRVTASFGVAEAQEETQPVELVAAADAALYEAKARGKNRVARAPAAARQP
jgi:PleD family two-component response regulator